MIQNLSDKELVHHVDNKPSATELEKELANRLDAQLQPRCPHGELLADYCFDCKDAEEHS